MQTCIWQSLKHHPAVDRWVKNSTVPVGHEDRHLQLFQPVKCASPLTPVSLHGRTDLSLKALLAHVIRSILRSLVNPLPPRFPHNILLLMARAEERLQ